MSESLTCDNCDKTSSMEGLVEWLAVSVVGIELSTWGGKHKLAGHYCSPRCLSERCAQIMAAP